jgi:TRAP-type C4-dicarboxylate transport system substrate-binding protein
MDRRSIPRTAVVAVAAVLLGTVPVAANSVGSDQVTLRLATTEGDVDGNGVSYGPRTFVDALSTLSGGRISVELVTGYGDGALDAESQVVKAIASGDVDGGWPPSRAFALAGLGGLQAIEAPMMLTNLAAVDELVSGDAARTALGALDGTGLTGLGLAVGTLRHPFSAAGPLLGPDDWKGLHFRAFNTPVQVDTIAALGAVPEAALFGWIDRVRDGTLAGSDFDVFQYLANGFTTETPDVTANVVLWPKVFVLSINQARFDALTAEQQGWIRAAATAAVRASIDGPYDESAVATELCRKGVHFPEADAAQLAALKVAVRPVVDGIAADPQSGPLLAQVEAIAARHPGTDAPDVPADCRLPSAEAAQAGPPDTTAAIPDGVYRQEITMDTLRQAGIARYDSAIGTWTLTIHEGTYTLECKAIIRPAEDCGGSGVADAVVEAGYVRGDADRVWLVIDAELLHKANGCALPPSHTQPGHCQVFPPIENAWTFDGTHLVMSPVPAPTSGLRSGDWVRIG